MLHPASKLTSGNAWQINPAISPKAFLGTGSLNENDAVQFVVSAHFQMDSHKNLERLVSAVDVQRITLMSSLLKGNDLDWRSALTLDERLRLMSQTRTHKLTEPKANIRWRLRRRADIARVRNFANAKMDPPHWLSAFENAYRNPKRQRLFSGSSGDFLIIVEPILVEARRKIHAALQKDFRAISPPAEKDRLALITSFERILQRRLLDVLARTLVLELTVSSRRGLLVGDTAEERFMFFCHCLADPDFARAILRQYPVLVRRVITIIWNWQAATLSLLFRLSNSHKTLQSAFFNNNEIGPLTSVEAAGDTHRKGNAVHILSFGSACKVVYKPRSISMESFYYDFIEWFNQHCESLDLRVVRTIDEGDFGWMEFVEGSPCTTKVGIERFFLRQGSQIALTYLLGGTDLHFENVIAHGEYPVLVDLETLFQTPLLERKFPGATARATRILQTSVLGTMLLPEPYFIGKGENWIDWSALGHSEGQLTPIPLPIWRDDGTDQMRLAHERVYVSGGVSLPTYEGTSVKATDNGDFIIRGLRDTYTFLAAHKSTLLSENGPLTAAFGNVARHVLRGTVLYEELLELSNHPHFLGDAIIAEGFLHNRLKASSNVIVWPEDVEDVEVEQLLSGDIPYFASKVGEGVTLTSGNKSRYTCASNGWDDCRNRVATLSLEDLNRQELFVRVALSELGEFSSSMERCYKYESTNYLTQEDLLSTASRIGDRIVELAITDKDRATWFIIKAVDEKRIVSRVAELDLYEGLSGIALFLGHLGAITGDQRYSDTAIAAIKEALELYQHSNSRLMPIGAYDGIAGLAYVLVHLGTLLGHLEWLKDAAFISKKSIESAMLSSKTDLISGKAGIVVAALAVYHRTNDNDLLRGVQLLVENLRKMVKDNCELKRSRLPKLADAGLAHGRAGIGFALLRWAEVSKEVDYRRIAVELINADMLAIDARLVSARQQRKPSTRIASHIGWCRGWLGAGLVALKAHRPARSFTQAEYNFFRRLADEIMASKGGGSLSLCHGMLGCLEYLAEARKWEILDKNDTFAGWEQRVLNQVKDGEWMGDEGHSLESPGLMMGLSGTGYSLLRTFRPRLVPSILTLDF
jgi:type 2 lantibiotic biosynthesis protein LanM